jgi:5-methylcytosine-specific restriction endonuclease McrA
MPIRPELRKFYGAAWRATRKRILARAEGRCEFCDVADRAVIVRGPGGFWSVLGGAWRDAKGEDVDGLRVPLARQWTVEVILSCAHLNHVAGDDRDDNLAALCQRCHLVYDARLHYAGARRTVAAKRGQAWLLPEIEGERLEGL